MLPKLYEGPPGVGKTTRVHVEGREAGLPVIQINLADKDRVEVCGGMVPNPKRKILEYYAPDWWVQACENPAIILLDELTTADPEQRTAGLRVADDSRTLGAFTLHPETRIRATMNPADYAAGAQSLLSAPELGGRWQIIQVDQTDAVRWMCGHEGRLGEFGRFCRITPTAALATPEAMKRAVADQKPFPTPRGWTRAVELSDEELHQIVGTAAAATYMTWVASATLPDPIEILAGRVMTVPGRADEALAVATGLVALVMNNGDHHWSLTNLFKWFRTAAESGYAGTVAGELTLMVSTHMEAVTGAMVDGGSLEHYAEMVLA